MVNHISEHQWYTEYEHEVFNNDKSIVILFGASWCEACHNLEDAINKANITNVEVVFLDVDKLGDLADDHGVTSLPFVVIYENCEVTDELNNNVSIQDIIEAIREVK